jgi:hypothetical protein
MKKLYLLLLTVLLSFCVLAQGEKGHIYLKNGNILKGKFQWADDFSTIRVESGGNLWVFDSDEVAKVSGRRAEAKAVLESMPQPKGLFMRTELGVLTGNSQNSQPAPFSFTGSMNVVIFPRISLGIGAGAEFLKETYMPAFLNLEYKFRPTWSSPYIFVKGGYQVPLEDSREIYYDVWPASSSVWPWPGPVHNYGRLNPEGGMLINSGMGYSHMFSPGFGMSVAFGYQFHRLQYSGEKDYHLDIDYNRLTVKLGFTFN